MSSPLGMVCLKEKALRRKLKWLSRAQLDDYVIAVASAPAATPFIGRYLEPVGAVAAMAVWGVRLMPGMLSARSRQHSSGVSAAVRKRDYLARTPDLMTEALRDLVGDPGLGEITLTPQRLAPAFLARTQRRDVYRASVRYGTHPAQVLDIWRRPELPSHPAPVLLFIPGGAWVFGSRLVQGHALMSHLTKLGWVCLSIQYRTSPRHRWPQQIVDVKAAIAWARRNVGEYGGDAGFVALAGCSAGGHLASLAGLTAGHPQWQTHLPVDADTSVNAVVSMYGRYDWEDRSTFERARFVEFLERVVVQRPYSRYSNVFHEASPLSHVHKAAPPFLVIHGSGDSVIPVDEARRFVQAMRDSATRAVGYLELPGTGHAFDLIDGPRTAAMTTMIGLYLNHLSRGQRPPVFADALPL